MNKENPFKQLCKIILPKGIIYSLTYIYNLIKINPEIKRKWKENIKYKNSHVGERCFILGNGPSLKDVPFEKLRDEFVFTVNDFSTIDNYRLVNTNIHLWFDSVYFKEDNDKMVNLIQNYKKIAELKPICFVPITAYDFLKKNRLDEILDIHYLLPRKKIIDGLIDKIELHKLIYQCTTVVQYAIQIAIYMGFSEIYLLGCDGTDVVLLMYNAISDQNISLHASDKYGEEENPKTYIKTLNMPDIFYGTSLFFLGYQKLDEYCKRNKIKLRNCSSITLINEVEREILDNVFSKGMS